MARLKNPLCKEILNNKFKSDISEDYRMEIRHAIGEVRVFARAAGARRRRAPGSAERFLRTRPDRSRRRLILSFCDFQVQLGRIRTCVPQEPVCIRIYASSVAEFSQLAAKSTFF